MTDNTPLPSQMLTRAEFGRRINRTVRTLERWDSAGAFKARRTPGGDPFYVEQDIERFLAGVEPDDTIETVK